MSVTQNSVILAVFLPLSATYYYASFFYYHYYASLLCLIIMPHFSLIIMTYYYVSFFIIIIMPHYYASLLCLISCLIIMPHFWANDPDFLVYIMKFNKLIHTYLDYNHYRPFTSPLQISSQHHSHLILTMLQLLIWRVQVQ